ncbi:MAG: DapH/DapD/GlmU-related protein [Planctomycetota bacterium]
MAIKRLAQVLGWLLAMPARLRYTVLRRLVGEARALSSVSEAVARRPGLLGIYLRQAFYRSMLSAVGLDVHFGYQTLLSKPEAELGDRVYLGRFCTIGWALIGDDAKLADGVQVLSGARHHQAKARIDVVADGVRYRPVRIGRGAWVGANAVVMADVGEGAVVGAGAVVTRSVAPHTAVAGVPAKPIAAAPEQRAA